MKVLFISANRLDIPHPVYPVGLDYVIGSLSSRTEVRVLDIGLEHEIDKLKTTMDDFDPDLVGITVRNLDSVDITSPQEYLTLLKETVSAVRRFGSAGIILGGSGFSIMPEAVLAASGADLGLVGAGERLPLVLEAMEEKRSPAAIPGVVVPGMPARRPEPYTGPFNRDLSLDPVRVARYLKKGGILNLQTKRGCPFRCSYCTYPLLEGKRFQLFDPDQVAREAKALEEAGAAYIYIVDSVFNADPAHTLAVAGAFRRVGLKTPWGGFFAPLKPPSGYYETLAGAGLTHVEFGTEAICTQTLKGYRKPYGVDDVFAAHRAARDAGLHVTHFLLLGGPGETPQTLETTLTRAEELTGAVMIVFQGVRIYPDTALWHLAVAQGQLSPETDLLHPVFYRSPEIDYQQTAELTAKRAKGRLHWIIGGGGKTFNALIDMMYRQGHTGPLWENLVPK